MASLWCIAVPTACLAQAGIGAVTKSVAGSAFQAVVDAFAKGLADVMKTLMTFWVNTPAPDVGPGSPVISTLNGLTRPLVAFAALVGLIFGAGRLVWSARGQQDLRPIMRGILMMVVVTGAGAVLVETLLTGFDALAVWILNNGFNGKSVGETLESLGSLPGAGGGLIFLLAFLGMLASLVQVGIMLVRGAILAVLVGLLPVAAAASITETGFAWFKRLVAWIFSFLLYKLVGAIIYAAAFALIGSSNDLAGTVSGFALIIVAILALPALLRLLPPAADAIGGGGGGAAAGMVSAGATGAVMLAGRGKSSGGLPASGTPGLKGGSGGSAGPTGASGTSGGASKGLSAAASGGAFGAAGAGAGAGGPAAAAGGPVGAGLAVAQKVHAAAKSGAHNAVGEGSGS